MNRPASPPGSLPPLTSPEIVRAAIARALRGKTAPSQLGTITLQPHQQDAVIRVTAALRDVHVALLADDVGLGKTFVALAVARKYRDILILAPAALLPMWRTAIEQAELRDVRIESIQRFSRAEPEHGSAATRAPTKSRQRSGMHGRSLVIVDEAHHLRTPTTRRYRAIADMIVGCDVLLMSATPVHNTPGDLRALLGLALGSSAARLSHALLSRVVVRRTIHRALPSVTTHPPLCMPHNPEILNAILALPSPLPAHEGAVAGALIRIGLLRAWCSSDAALTHALRRRLLRGEALLQALLAGRHPTSLELRSWLVGDHEVQLAFPELMAQHASATGPLLDVLSAHIEGVRGVLNCHQASANGDPIRTKTLAGLLAAHPETPIIAFSQYSETVRAIGRALSDIAGVGILTDRRAWIASGAITRMEALGRFAPKAQGRPPPPSHQRIRLLLTTDLLSEGVNLQDAGVVVHLDLPWTDARRAQRVGRCVRLGSEHTVVHVYAFEPPMGANAVLRLTARIARKARMARHFVGARRSAPTPARSGMSAAELASDFRETLLSWHAGSQHTSANNNEPLVSLQAADSRGFLALVCLGNAPPHLIGAHARTAAGRRSPRWRVSGTIRGLALLMQMASEIQSSSTPPVEQVEAFKLNWPDVVRIVERWGMRLQLRQTLGLTNGGGSPLPDIPLSPVHQRARATVTNGVAALPLSRRAEFRNVVQRTRHMLDSAQGSGVERALHRWMRTYPSKAFTDWIHVWRTEPLLDAATELGAEADPSNAHRPTILAVMIFVPPT